MSNARVFLRLSYGACLLSLAACAQGIQTPMGEDLTDTGDTGGGGTGAVSVANTTFAGSSTNSSGSSSTGEGGSLGTSGSASGGSSPSGGTSAGNGSAAGSSAGGAPGAAGTGAAGSSAGSAGANSVGGGTGALGCTYAQPGDVGFALQYKWENATDSIYFDVEIDNPNQRTITIGALKFRYYLVTSDLGTLSTDFYLKQIKKLNGTTQDLDVTPTATVTDSYLEIAFPGSTSTLATGESLTVKIHTHNSDYKIHDETLDYSYSPSTTLIPWCKIVLWEQTAMAWGTPPPM